MSFSDRDRPGSPWEEREIAEAAAEAGAIGGRAGDEDLDPAQRPLVEGGEGEAEGFELSEEDLIEAAEHGDSDADPLRDAFTPERESDEATVVPGEADHEQSTEVPKSDA
jgi:hypothetical protein